MDLNEVKQETAKFDMAIHPEIATLLKRHMQLNFLIVAILVIVIAAGLFFGIHAMQVFEVNLARAEQMEKDYEQVRQEKEAVEKDNLDLRNQLAQAQVKLNNQVSTINKLAATRKTQLAAATTPAQVAAQSQQEFNSTPTINNNLLCYTPDEAKVFIEAGIERDQLSKTQVLMQELIESEKKQNSLLQSDFDNEHKLRLQAESVAAGYKKVAKKGKWKTFFTSVKHVVYITGAVAVVVGLHSAGVF